jgi:hypothetical protein
LQFEPSHTRDIAIALEDKAIADEDGIGVL